MRASLAVSSARVRGRMSDLKRGPVEPAQLIILLVIVLLIFGAKRLPEIARSIGSSSREFRKGIQGADDDTPAPPPANRDDNVA